MNQADYHLISLQGRTSVVVSSLELSDQVCDQKRFHKAVEGPLREIRHLTKDGLFTAFHGEPNWASARKHNCSVFCLWLSST